MRLRHFPLSFFSPQTMHKLFYFYSIAFLPFIVVIHRFPYLYQSLPLSCTPFLSLLLTHCFFRPRMEQPPRARQCILMLMWTEKMEDEVEAKKTTHTHWLAYILREYQRLWFPAPSSSMAWKCVSHKSYSILRTFYVHPNGGVKCVYVWLQCFRLLLFLRLRRRFFFRHPSFSGSDECVERAINRIFVLRNIFIYTTNISRSINSFKWLGIECRPE